MRGEHTEHRVRAHQVRGHQPSGFPLDPPEREIVRLIRQRERTKLIDEPGCLGGRSNPASYVGALDAIRKRFAAEPVAIERGYTAGTFSFNSGNGRCPSCGGNGFEHVEMQFLSDVYLRCPDCDGRRYRSEVLEVKTRPAGEAGWDTGTPRSIADILEMTVDDALAFFAGSPDVVRPLTPLAAVGLGYLRLGQPVPALSGGEAQRLKLARHLAPREAGRGPRHVLFIFDEPTTGLHLQDVSRLLEALDALLAAGHSVLVIEHHLDVIAAADWIVDLGPEGGSGGGRMVATGRPRAVARRRRSHTGAALRAHFAEREPGAAPLAAAPARARSRGNGAIAIRNAREHNLHGADIDIPRDRFTVITGVSGSGKSTVAFDILFAEGQRRYLESLNAYARQFVQPAARPDVDAIFGIPPSVAIEQRTSRGGYKSTVGTMTEIHHFLRLLFVRLGTQHCPDCGIAIEPQDPGRHRRPGAQAAPGARGRDPRPAGGSPQGLLHGPCQVGREARPRDAARRRRAAPHRRLAAARPLPGARHRPPPRLGRRPRGSGVCAARDDRARPRPRGGKGPGRRPPRRDPVLHRARLPRVREELRRAGPAALIEKILTHLAARTLHPPLTQPPASPSPALS